VVVGAASELQQPMAPQRGLISSISMYQGGVLAMARGLDLVTKQHGWVGQVVQESATQQFLHQRRRDQQRALQLLRDDPGLRCAL